LYPLYARDASADLKCDTMPLMASGVGDKVQELLSRASQDLEAGRLDSAKWNLQRLLAKDPRQADALHMAALIAAREGNVQQSLALFQQAIASAPNEARHHYNYGVLLLDGGRADATVLRHITAGCNGGIPAACALLPRRP
jgi:Tfp pilus assembly protein PilF